MPTMSGAEQWFCRSAPWVWWTSRVVLPWALHGFEPHGEVLELGAGSGAMAAATARTFPDVHLTVTDIDPTMVAAAASRLKARPNVEVQRADVTDLPFADDSFDVVTSYLMLHHVVNWHQALVEAARVLRPGGVLIGYDLDKTRVATLVHVVDRSPYRLIHHDQWRAALETAGLQRIEVRRALRRHVVTFKAEKYKPAKPERQES